MTNTTYNIPNLKSQIDSEKIQFYDKHSHILVWCEISLILLTILLESTVFIWEMVFPSSSPETLYIFDVVINTFFCLVWILVTFFNLYVYIMAHSHKKNNRYHFWNHVLEGPFKLVLNISLILAGSLMVMITFACSQFLHSGIGSFDPFVFQSLTLFWIISMFVVLCANIILMILAYHYRKGEYIIN